MAKCVDIGSIRSIRSYIGTALHWRWYLNYSNPQETTLELPVVLTI